MSEECAKDDYSNDKDEELNKVIKPDDEPKLHSEHELMSMFESWMAKYYRNYKTLEEKEMRFEAFKETVRLIEENDPLKTGYTLALNRFADETYAEFHDYVICCMDPCCKMPSCSNKTGSCSKKTGSPSCQTMPLCSDKPIGVLGKTKSTKKKKKLKSRLT